MSEENMKPVVATPGGRKIPDKEDRKAAVSHPDGIGVPPITGIPVSTLHASPVLTKNDPRDVIVVKG